MLHVLHPCDEDAAVTCDKAARLDKDLQAKRLEQRDEFGCVLGRGEQIFALGRAPPLGLAAFQCGIVNNAKPSADAEKLDAVFFGQTLGQGYNFFNSFFKRPDLGEL